MRIGISGFIPITMVDYPTSLLGGVSELVGVCE